MNTICVFFAYVKTEGKVCMYMHTFFDSMQTIVKQFLKGLKKVC